jgi:hypothetical protein
MSIYHTLVSFWLVWNPVGFCSVSFWVWRDSMIRIVEVMGLGTEYVRRIGLIVSYKMRTARVVSL